jgi:hypothetical protein
MTGFISPTWAEIPSPVYAINTLGSFQLKTGGGCLISGVNVRSAGSVDSTIRLYDGTSAEGQLIATVGFGSPGLHVTPNQSFATGLFAVVAGTTAGSAEIYFK